MKYIIMAGGNYRDFEIPKHLLKVNGEVVIERTIRLLRKNKIKDIAISTNNPAFDYLDVPILHHNNDYTHEDKTHDTQGCWLNAFYPTDEPVCYIFGDVYFSEEAIKQIVETKVEDIELFASKEPFAINYPKRWIEPFALKVQNQAHLKASIEKTKELSKEGKLWRKHPIIWELWTVISNAPLQVKAGEYLADYIAINDYTSDIDDKNDIIKLEKYIKGGVKMVKLEAIDVFTLGRFGELRNIERISRTENGKLFKGDKFECNEELAEYLLGKNAYGKPYVKVIEIIPEEVKEKPKVEQKEEKIVEQPKKSNKKKKSKK